MVVIQIHLRDSNTLSELATRIHAQQSTPRPLFGSFCNPQALCSFRGRDVGERRQLRKLRQLCYVSGSLTAVTDGSRRLESYG